MSVPPLSRLTIRRKERRAANNNYSKLCKTLRRKLEKLCSVYDAEIYFVAYRNGRYNGFMTTDDRGQSWSPPDNESLVSRLLFYHLSAFW
jgi:hypothetical protein